MPRGNWFFALPALAFHGRPFDLGGPIPGDGEPRGGRCLPGLTPKLLCARHRDFLPIARLGDGDQVFDDRPIVCLGGQLRALVDEGHRLIVKVIVIALH